MTLVEADIEVPRRAVTVTALLSVDAGERLALFGPSGAGKTTVLEALAGLTRLGRGSVRVGGDLVASAGRRREEVAPRRRGIGLVRQPTTLFPHLTVEQNVAYGAGAAPLSQLLEQTGLWELRAARPARLSGGQRQRVALARALAMPFRVLLLDEPLSAIDGPTRAELRELAAALAAERQAAAVLVTHDLPEAQAFGTALGILDAGRVLQLGDPREVVRQPASRRVAELVGYTGFVPAPAAGGSGGKSGDLLAIHPDAVLAGAHPDRGVVLTGTVVAVRPHGVRHECQLVLRDAGTVDVRLEEPPAQGSDCTVTALHPPVVAGDPATEQAEP